MPGEPVGAEMKSIIEVIDLTRRFIDGRRRSVVALDSINLEIAEREVVGLLGPNGAGKTTLVRILTTLLLPSSGRAVVAGFDVANSAKEVRSRVGLVLGGERGLYSRLTARQNIALWAALSGLSSRDARKRTSQVLEQFGLNERADSQVATFSRGMVQRVHLARALVPDPPILILDEPTSGLDPNANVGFRRLITSLQDEGRTILLATHDLAEAQQICSQVTLIDRGKVLASGPPNTLREAAGEHREVTADGVPKNVSIDLSKIPGITMEPASDDGRFRASASSREAAGEVVRRLISGGAVMVELAPPSLEDVYRRLIKDREFSV